MIDRQCSSLCECGKTLRRPKVRYGPALFVRLFADMAEVIGIQEVLK
jgi:hypothetical protein